MGVDGIFTIRKSLLCSISPRPIAPMRFWKRLLCRRRLLLSLIHLGRWHAFPRRRSRPKRSRIHNLIRFRQKDPSHAALPQAVAPRGTRLRRLSGFVAECSGCVSWAGHHGAGADPAHYSIWHCVLDRCCLANPCFGLLPFSALQCRSAVILFPQTFGCIVFLEETRCKISHRDSAIQCAAD